MVPSSRELGTRDGKESSSILGAHVFMRLLMRFEPLDGELIGNVIFVNIADVLDRREPQDIGGAQLDIIEPDVRIEARLLGESAKLA